MYIYISILKYTIYVNKYSLRTERLQQEINKCLHVHRVILDIIYYVIR